MTSDSNPLVAALDAFGDPNVLYHRPAMSWAAQYLDTTDVAFLTQTLLLVANRAHRWLSVLEVPELTFDGGEGDVFVDTAVAILDVGPSFRLDKLDMHVDDYTAAVVQAVVPEVFGEYGPEGLRRVTTHVFTSTYQLAEAISGK